MKMKPVKLLSLLLLLVCVLGLAGCTPTKAWLSKDYLGKTSAAKALEDINEYISLDSSSADRKNELLFQKAENNPLVGTVYQNDAGVMLFFDQESLGIKGINLVYLNNDRKAMEATKILTVQICEMIDPMDYVLDSENSQHLLNHLNLEDTSLQLYEMSHNNNTRVEKLAENGIGLPLTFIRFSKKDGDSLEQLGQNIFLKMLQGYLLED